MSIVKRALGLAALLCLAVLVCPISASASSNQLLYVHEASSLITYSVNPKTAVATKLGSLYMNALQSYPVQVFHSPTSPYIYILGFASATEEYFWVHATTPEGVPTENPIQKLAVKPSLTQFFIHPNGHFAYALYSWTDQTTGQFVGDIVLYTINPKTGKLTNTRKPLANFPANYYWQTFLYGFNSTGTKFYTRAYVDFRDSNGNDFYSYEVNSNTGALTGGTFFWRDDGANQGSDFSAIGDKLIGEDFNFNECCGYAGIHILKNSANATTANPIIACTSNMLAECGDNESIQFDPTGKYLFLTTTTNNTKVIAIDLATRKLKKTGASMSDAPKNGVTFSPDGMLAYAIKDPNEVLVYAFNPANGLFTAHSSFTVPSQIGQLVPAK
jgi:hypothetical protein